MDAGIYQVRPCGLMDKAPDFGSGDCRFESCHARARKNFCRSVEISALYATFVIVAFVNANGLADRVASVAQR